MNKIILFFSIFFICNTVHGQEETMTKDRIGPGKAVLFANEKDGFMLSEKAANNLNILLEDVDGPVVSVPRESLVSFLDFLIVFRFRDGWYRSIEIEPSYHGNLAKFFSKEFRAGDQIVVKNGNLLRVVELDVFGPEADACADGS